MKLLCGLVVALATLTGIPALETVQNSQISQEDARKQQEEAIKKLPEYEQKFVKALQYAQTGEWDKAFTESEASLALNATQPGVYFLQSQIYLVENKNKLALEKIKKANEFAPTNTLIKSQVTFHEAIEIQQDEGDLPKALSKFKESVKQMKDDFDAKSLEKGAIAIAALGDIPSAMEVLKTLWKDAPFFIFHNNIPFVRMADKYDEMVEHARAKGPAFVEALKNDLSNITTVTDQVYFDVSVGEAAAKRVTIGLYGLAAPRAVHNLVTMFSCTLGEHYCYKGTKFHRVIKDFIVQGGDVYPGDGTGRTNIYDRPYGDEVFATALMHDRPGVVQMANSGPDSNGGQFVILVAPAAHLNGQHVVVGRVVEGLEHVIEANKVEVDSSTFKPKQPVTIVDCGVVKK